MSSAIRVSDLHGPRLNYAVALIEGWEIHAGAPGTDDALMVRDGQFSQLRALDYCGDHAVGAPIVEREDVTVLSPRVAGGSWFAVVPRELPPMCGYRDQRQLVAAMRAVVASRIAAGFILEGRGL